MLRARLRFSQSEALWGDLVSPFVLEDHCQTVSETVLGKNLGMDITWTLTNKDLGGKFAFRSVSIFFLLRDLIEGVKECNMA